MQSESSKSIERWQLFYVQMNICHLKTLKEKTPMITKGNHEIDKLLIKAKHLVLPLRSANETTLTSSGLSLEYRLFIYFFIFLSASGHPDYPSS
jgi:hypothetical protein